MLFASLDYLQYRLQRGAYSRQALEAQGGRLATSTNFPEGGRGEAGNYFVMHTRTSTLSWLIMYLTHSAWSHAGIFARGGYVVDATTAGMLKHRFSDYMDGRSYVMISDLPLSEEERSNVIERAESLVGAAYGWGKALRMGRRIVLGRHHNYHPRISADILLTLALLSLPALAWPRVLVFTGSLAVMYVVVVLCNWPYRRRVRKQASASSTGISKPE